MAIPPFSITETVPQDNDVVLGFPTAERAYRDTVESWLTFISDPTTGLLLPGKYRAWTIQDFVTPGAAVWTKPSGCQRVIVEGSGGGAGSGAVDGQAGNTTGASGGGGSGWAGVTGILDVTGVASINLTIGAGGIAGAVPSGTGGNGGNTSFVHAAQTYQWGGGLASAGYVANASYCAISEGGNGGGAIFVAGGSMPGSHGVIGAVDGNAHGGDGGSNKWGTGGQGRHGVFATMGAVALVGSTGLGFGSGAGGSIVCYSTLNIAGGVGTGGWLRFWELY